MKKILRSEAKIGLIVLVALGVFFWGLNYLKGSNLFHSTNHYSVEYTNINGLVKSSPVNLDGYQIGLVSNIKYQYNNPGHILVDLDLDKKIKLPKGTKATIQSALIGNPSIVLTLGDPSNSFLKSGDALIADLAPGLMDQLSKGLLTDVQNMVKRTDSLLASVDVLLNNGSLVHSLSSIEKTSKELSLMSVKLNASMNKLPGILDNVDLMTSSFTKAGDKLNQLDVSSINKTLKHFEEVTAKLNSPDNSMGLLLNDQALYLNLKNTTSSANELLIDLKASPKRYVHFSLFGSKTK